MCKLVSNGVHLSVSLHDLSTIQQKLVLMQVIGLKLVNVNLWLQQDLVFAYGL